MSLKKIIISLSVLTLSVVLICGCHIEHLDDIHNSRYNSAIDFKAFGSWEDTKAQSTNSDNLLQFNVFGYQSAADVNFSVDAPNFMYNKSVTKKAGSGWVYSPIQYWPDDGSKLSFWAYGPVSEDHKDEIKLFSPKDEAGYPRILYTLSLDYKNIIDFVVSEPIINKTKADPNVAFNFFHALSVLEFGFKLSNSFPSEKNQEIKLESVWISSLQNSGMYSYPNWGPGLSPKKDYTYDLSINGGQLKDIQITKTEQNLVSDDVNLYMIPQDIYDSADLFFKLKIEKYKDNKVIESSYVVYKVKLDKFIKKFEVNRKYKLSIEFVEKNNISITATVKDWEVKEIILPSFE